MDTLDEAQPETRRGVLFDAAEQELFTLISVTAKSRRTLAARLDERLPPAAVPVLGMILKCQSITQSEICEHLMTDKATLSRLVTRLEELGLVSRQVDEADRRVSNLLPTELAKERWRGWLQSWREGLRERITQWSDDDLDHLVGLLGRLNTDLREL
ncbi:hypothetical protein CQ019_11525 [Arthrobacter sp. MYb229]|uniref:MarR family winged helix-turn-helix transcriptional regulator n=1 Tax=unclassified Arthrobacter TaxID=235627 RepID=UPI000D003220|nr:MULTISPECIES: MarR family transcriptional regulator [unclassified Arthrobacter]PRA03085.1 hypothetical protein CQ019_11525 [Arthrobacter sp. MYb229]PRB49556.1 hypothetical protein CQ013_13005 [Arthrobacter sp. MYb216]